MVADLHIRGDLPGGDDIETAGNIVVEGSVKTPCTLRAGGDVNIGGHLASGVRILARGDIRIQGPVQGAHVRAGGRVHLGSAPTAQAVDGGEARAVQGILVDGAVETGPANPTSLGVLTDPTTAARLDKARERLDFVDNEISRILRTLELTTVDETAIREVFRRTPPAKRTFFIEILKQLQRFVGLREQLVAKRDQQETAASDHLRQIEVAVTGLVRRGVEVIIGETRLAVPDELTAPVFYFEDTVRWRAAN